MAAEAVGDGVEQDRAVATVDDLLLARDGVDDGQRVVAVHALGVHLLRVQAGAEAGEDLEAHGLADGLAAHAVEVVDEVEDQRQAAAVCASSQSVLNWSMVAKQRPSQTGPQAEEASPMLQMTMPGLRLTCL